MDFPIFKLKPEERATIYAVLSKYPEAMDKQYKLEVKVLGLSVRPSFRVRGVLAHLIGPNPVV